MRNPGLVCGVLCCLWAAACTGSASSGPPRARGERPPEISLSREEGSTDKSLVRSSFIGRLPAGTFGPRLLLRGSAGHAVWAEVEGEERGYYALPLRGGVASEAPSRFAGVPDRLAFFELASLSEGRTIVLSVVPLDGGDALRAHVISPRGELLGGPHELSSGPGSILWVRAAPAGDDVALLVARQQGAAARLESIPFGASGATAPSVTLAEDMRSWQLGVHQGSAVLATVEGTKGASRLVVRRLSGARVDGLPVTVAEGLSGGLDLDLAVLGDRVVVAHTEPGPAGPRLRGAVLGRDGSVISPWGEMTPPRGEQTLLRLVPAARTVFVVWEEPRHSAATRRELFVSPVGPSGRVEIPAVRLFSRGNSPLLPQLAAAGDQLVGVSQASSCEDAEAPCQELGTFWARIPAAGEPTGSEIWLPQKRGETPAMVWDLVCEKQACFALMANQGGSPEVVLAEVRLAEGGKARIAERTEAGRRLTQEDFLSEILPLADLSGSLTEQTRLLSWVSFFDPMTPYERPKRPAPDGRMAPVRALLHVQSLTTGSRSQATGSEVIAAQTDEVISYRARSLGGVSLTAPRAGSALLAWAALDGAVPQVFATLVDAKGRKLRQRMLTRSKGEVTEVTALRLGERFLVVWVDGSTLPKQIRGVMLDEQLRAIIAERVLVAETESAADLALFPTDQGVRLVYGEGGSTRQQADLRSVLLDTSTLASGGLVIDLESSPLHGHSPTYLQRLEPEAPRVLGHIEEQSEAGGKERSWLRILPVNPAGLPESVGIRVPFPGQVRGVSGECLARGCRIAALVSHEGVGELWGVFVSPEVLSGAAPSVPFFLSRQDRHAVQTAPPLVLGGSIFLENRAPDGRWELSRVEVEW